MNIVLMGKLNKATYSRDGTVIDHAGNVFSKQITRGPRRSVKR